MSIPAVSANGQAGMTLNQDLAQSDGRPATATPASETAPLTGAVATSIQGRDLLFGVALIYAMAYVVDTAVGVVAKTIVQLKVDSGHFVGSSVLDSIPAGLIFGPIVLMHLWTLMVCCYFVCQKYKKPFIEGFSIKRVSTRFLILSILLGVGGAIAALTLTPDDLYGDSYFAQLISKRSRAVTSMVIGVLCAPFEEIYYRGFLFPSIRARTNAVSAILIVSLWFCLMHVPQYAGDWEVLIPVLLIGLVLTVLREATNSLVPSIVTHVLYNLSLYVIHFAMNPL